MDAVSCQPGPPSRVLVLEDGDEMARLMTTALTREGYEARHVGSLADFRRSLSVWPCDLVTVDLGLPDGNGLEAIEALQDGPGVTGSLVVTGQADSQSAVAAMRAGALGYVMKPFRISLLMQEIDRALEYVGLQAENLSYRRHLAERVAEQAEELRHACAELEARQRQLLASDALLSLRMGAPQPRDQLAAAVNEALARGTGSPWALAYGADATTPLHRWAPAGDAGPEPAPRPTVRLEHGEAQLRADGVLQVGVGAGDQALQLLFGTGQVPMEVVEQLARDATLTLEAQACAATLMVDPEAGDPEEASS